MASRRLGAVALTVGVGWLAWSGTAPAAADSSGTGSDSGPSTSSSTSESHSSSVGKSARAPRAVSGNDAGAAKSQRKVAAAPAPSAATSRRVVTSRPVPTTSVATPQADAVDAPAATSATQTAGSSASQPNAQPAVADTKLIPSAALAPSAPPVPPEVRQAWSFVGSIVDAALSVVQRLVAPFPTPTGEPPVTWLLLGWVRREIGSSFFNSTPTAQPVQIVQALDGKVTGAVNGSDVDGDNLTYTLGAAPTKGAVTVDADGVYTYTPSAALAATGGTDTFTVTVADDGVHLANVGTADRVEVPVTVTIAAPGSPTTAVGDGSVHIALSADGKHAYVLGANQTVAVIDTDPTTAATGVIDTIRLGSSRTVTLTDPVTGTQTTQTYSDNGNFDFTAIAASRAGNVVYVVNRATGTVSVIETDPVTGGASAIDTIAVGSGASAITLSADGTKAYVVGGDDGSVAVIDTASRTIVARVIVGAGASAGAVSPDGTRLYVTNTAGNTVSVIDTASATVVKTLTVGGRPVAVVSSPDGKYVYTANSQSNSVSMIDIATGKVTNILVGGSPSAVAVSPDGTHLYVTESAGNRVAVVDTAARAVVTRVAVGDGPQDLALSSDGKQAYVVNLYDGSLSQIGLAPLPVAAPQTTQLLGSTKGFHIYNVTGQDLTLTYKQGNFEKGGPAIGSILAPGTYMDLEVVVPFLSDNIAIENWKTADGLTNFQADNWVYSWPLGSRLSCNAGGGGRQCATNTDRSEIYFIDAPDTVISLDGPSGQQQAKVLNQLCYEGSLASCDFEPDNGQLYYNDEVPAPGSLINDTSVQQSRDITVTREVTNTINWKVSFTAGSGKLVEAVVNKSFTVEFGHNWSEKKTFVDKRTVIVPPRTAIRVYSSDPVDRLYGHFVLKMYNTTWDLSNVYFDSADKTSEAILTYRETPIVPTDNLAEQS